MEAQLEMVGRTQKIRLGLVATSTRAIKSGREFDQFFPKPNGKTDILNPDGTVYDTVKLMEKMVKDYKNDTEIIAQLLVKGTLFETLENIWNFCYSHIQYHPDKEGLEELRRPAVSWAERKKGVDCDCFSIFISSILTNLKIPHEFRVTKYTADWQHVYVFVPVTQGNIILDPVLDAFNYEKEYTKKFDYKMDGLGLPIASLNGVKGTVNTTRSNLDEKITSNILTDVVTGADFKVLKGLGDTNDVKEAVMEAIYNNLYKTYQLIMSNPELVLEFGGARVWQDWLEYALKFWHTPQRNEALRKLAKDEARWNNYRAAIAKEYGSTPLSGFFQDVGDFFSNVWSGISDVAEDVVEWTGNAAQQVGRFILRYNPITASMRGAYLLAMKVNLLGFAKRMYPGYLTREEANQIPGMTDKWYNAAQKTVEIQGKAHVAMGGKEENFRKAILEGKAKKRLGLDGIDGLGALGDGGATIAAIITAAVPIVTTAITADNSDLPSETEIDDGTNRAGEEKWYTKVWNFLKKFGADIVNIFKKVDEQTGGDLEKILNDLGIVSSVEIRPINEDYSQAPTGGRKVDSVITVETVDETAIDIVTIADNGNVPKVNKAGFSGAMYWVLGGGLLAAFIASQAGKKKKASTSKDGLKPGANITRNTLPAKIEGLKGTKKKTKAKKTTKTGDKAPVVKKVVLT